MKVLHVISGLGVGGAESMLSSVSLALHRQGIKQSVVCLTSGGKFAEQLRASGISVTELGMRRGRPSLCRMLTLVFLIRSQRPDVIQSWMYHADLLATLALLLSGRRMQTLLCWGIRCSNLNFKEQRIILRSVVRICSLLSGIPDCIIANSQAGRNVHVVMGYRSSRIRVIANGIDTIRYHPDPDARQKVRSLLGLNPDTPLIAHVARVDPMKDHQCFLDALARLPSVAAIVVGSGTDMLPDRRGLYRFGCRSDVHRLLAASDIIVSSSAYGEGFPTVVAEGMACGLPAVVTDVGDSARIVGDTGYVVASGNPQQLAQAIRLLLDETPDQRRIRSEHARRRIEEHYSLDSAVRAFLDVYRSGLLQEKPQHGSGVS